MLKKNNFIQNCFINIKTYRKNIKKTKLVFNLFKKDLENNQIPFLESYQKNYKLDFSPKTIKKYSKYKNIIVIGMGGSTLGTKCIYNFLKKKIKKNVFFFDNLDENLNLNYRKISNIKNSCFIAISKSGNTLETISNLNLIFKKNIFKNKLIIITEIKDSNLMDLGDKFNAEIIEHKEFIGGRYSVLSEVGMFPAALMGINIEKLKNFKILIKNKNFVSSVIENVAGIYTLYKRGVKNSVILNYDSSLNNLGHWYEQLVGESLGKKGKGISPILSIGPKYHHSLLQLYLDGPKDKFFTFFNLSKKDNKFKIKKKIIHNNIKFLKNKSLRNIVNAQLSAVKKVFSLKKIPYREIVFKNKNEEELGEIFIFFVLEIILLSKLLGVNPFDQPAVEQVKIKTKNFLV